jgi:cell surface protein SprA
LGAQSLFGVKPNCNLKTTVTGVFFRQKSQSVVIWWKIEDFEMFALDYDSDRHFFLSQYFRNKYDVTKNYPFIDSRVQVSRLEISK